MGTRVAGQRGLLEPFEALSKVAPIKSYLEALVAPPETVDYYTRITSWPMALNNQYGDCTIAGIIHILQIQAMLCGFTFAYPGDAETKITYFGLTGGQDTGLPLSAVVNDGSTNGLFSHKIVGAGSINPHDITTLKQTIDIYGVAYTAGALPSNAEQQFEAGEPWELVPGGSPIEGGHCFPLVGYDDDFLYASTWAAIQPVTYGWWHQYGTQAYALIFDYFKIAGKGPVADYNQMQQDLQALASETDTTTSFWRRWFGWL
jgi:hypothetical protein